jgi:ABC-type transport system involved in multi-copper enzyme maturation permease subunit
MLTPEQHNKYLAWSHIGYGALFVMLVLFIMLFIGVAFLGASTAGPNGPPLAFMLFIWLFLGLIYGAMTIPCFVAGYGLLKRRKWARTASIISAVVAAMNFPFGTAVCVYTFWLLFSEPGKALFERNTYSLPAGQQTWANESWNYDARRQREAQYDPPQPPPDWR